MNHLIFKEDIAYGQGDKKCYLVTTKRKDILATIIYYPMWKEYVLAPQLDTVWSAGCMKEVISFIGRIE